MCYMARKSIMAVLVILAIVLVSTLGAAAEDNGAEEMVLQGGKLGNVAFPHHRHHHALGDCAPCHNLFPKLAGVIERLKVEEKLQKKKVMKQCQACHKEKAGKGEKTGPTKCKACHQK